MPSVGGCITGASTGTSDREGKPRWIKGDSLLDRLVRISTEASHTITAEISSILFEKLSRRTGLVKIEDLVGGTEAARLGR